MKYLSEDAKTVLTALREQIFKTMREPTGDLAYPFLEPGTGYHYNLWDWDSYWTAYGANDMTELLKDDPGFDYAEKKRALARCVKGNVTNFLRWQEADGYVPISVRPDYRTNPVVARENYRNAHKPFLCRHALFATGMAGESDWLETDKLERYLGYYRTNQYDEKSGLYFWGDDVMIGMDNNPTVFGRPDRSAADLFLNCFMVSELDAMAKLLTAAGKSAARYEAERDALAASVRREMWDEGTGYFYSQDLLSKTKVTPYFHHGLGVFWNTMPLKIKFWGCYLPMTCGIATEEQARRMVENYRKGALNAPYGVRTVAKDEKMYRLEFSANPSNWLGAVWTVSNYCVFEGFLRYGFRAEAEKIRDGTLAYLANDIRTSGSMSESYHPDTGEPFPYNGFLSWNCLAASMIRETL